MDHSVQTKEERESRSAMSSLQERWAGELWTVKFKPFQFVTVVYQELQGDAKQRLAPSFFSYRRLAQFLVDMPKNPLVGNHLYSHLGKYPFSAFFPGSKSNDQVFLDPASTAIYMRSRTIATMFDEPLDKEWCIIVIRGEL